jgi:GDP-D-mannose dehydratase
LKWEPKYDFKKLVVEMVESDLRLAQKEKVTREM